jgi:hypothetical protein
MEQGCRVEPIFHFDKFFQISTSLSLYLPAASEISVGRLTR